MVGMSAGWMVDRLAEQMVDMWMVGRLAEQMVDLWMVDKLAEQMVDRLAYKMADMLAETMVLLTD
jgi:hypothetical protein